MKQKNAQANMLIGMFVVLLVGIIIASIIFAQVGDSTDVTPVSEDQFTAATTCTRVTTDCYAQGSSTGIKNNTAAGVALTNNVTECGENNKYFGYLTDGTITGQTVNVSYNGISCSHVSGFTATILDYLPLLIGVVLLAFTAGFIVLRR